MKIPTSIITSIFLSVTSSQAALIAVFEYKFPSSYDGTTTSFTDLSGAGNHATMTGENGGANIGLSVDVPVGAPASARSLDFSTNYGVVTTNATSLLNNAAVISNGGFTISTSLKGFSENPRKVIDYAGTEFIAIRNDGLDGARIGIGLNSNVVMTLKLADGVDPTGWNEVIYAFKVTDGSNVAAEVGDLSVNVNGTVTTLAGQTLTDFGDSLNRSIGLGRHPVFSSEHFRGQIYDPKVYLGVAEVPEPSSSLLVMFGSVLLLKQRRR